MTEIITSDDILGKEVINSEGEIIGVVQKIHIEKHKKEIVGITVDEGFMKPDIFIGLDNIRLFGKDGIFLNTTSDIRYRGMKVFNKEGTPIGILKEVIKNPKTGKIKEIQIREGLKTITIPAKDIKSIENNVILK